MTGAYPAAMSDEPSEQRQDWTVRPGRPEDEPRWRELYRLRGLPMRSRLPHYRDFSRPFTATVGGFLPWVTYDMLP
jgi:hypothetical protein